jgi:hypothetical protein
VVDDPQGPSLVRRAGKEKHRDRARSMRFIFAVLLAAVCLACGPRLVWAWGDQGHKVICEIAMRLAQPNTRAEVQKLISNDERFDSFSDSCTWPDHPRQRASEHFLNLPRDSDGLHSESCPGASACVVTAIKKDLEILSSNSASQAKKLESLKFLGHWVGDIHQPLHVSFDDDRGGNGRVQCVYSAGELGQHTIAGQLDQSAAVPGQCRLQTLRAMHLQPRERAALVPTHQPGVANRVRAS